MSKSRTRREFLEHLVTVGAGALATSLAAGGVIGAISKNASAASKKFRYGMVIDTLRCIGCRSCVVACKAENKTPPGVAYNQVLEDAFGVGQNDKPLFATKPCFHCENPPCVPVCPIGATYKRKEDGIVVVDYDRCKGLGFCVSACPYDARSFDIGDNYPAVAKNTDYAKVPSPEYKQFFTRKKAEAPIGKVRKCTFCAHLQDENGKYDKADGRWPSCTKTCTGHAIFFGDLNDRASDASKLLKKRHAVRLNAEFGTEPNVYYLL